MTAVAVSNLALDTVSSDLSVDTTDTTAVAAAATAVITNVSPSHRLCIIVDEVSGDGAAALTVKAGDNPPAQRQGLGDLSLTVASGTSVIFFLEAARYMQDDDTIDIEIADNDVIISAFHIPNGA